MSNRTLNESINYFNKNKIIEFTNIIKKIPKIPEIEILDRLFYLPSKRVLYNELNNTGWGISKDLFNRRIPNKQSKGNFFPPSNSSLSQYFTKEIYYHIVEIANEYCEKIKHMRLKSIL